MVTIRLTEDEHERLKARAREAGVSVEAYLRAAAEGKAYQLVQASPYVVEAIGVAHSPGPERVRPLTYAEQLKRARGQT